MDPLVWKRSLLAIVIEGLTRLLGEHAPIFETTEPDTQKRGTHAKAKPWLQMHRI
jgi:hypothetical protein